MTWLLVRISPSGDTTTPEPVPSARLPVAHGCDLYVHDRRRHRVDGVDNCARIGIQQVVVSEGAGGGCSCSRRDAVPTRLRRTQKT